MSNIKMSKTLYREGYSGKKSFVSETVIEICGGKLNLFSSDSVVALCHLCHFLSQQSQATEGLVEISTLLGNNK